MAQLLLLDRELLVFPQLGSAFTVGELTSLIGNDLQPIPVDDQQVMLVDEAGRRKNLPVNLLASALVPFCLRPGEVIVGPALVATLRELENKERQGNQQPRTSVGLARQQQDLAFADPAYMLDAQDQMELSECQRKLAPLAQRIAAL